MRIKILLSVFITMMALVLGCRNDKANEKQIAANQQEASPTPSNDNTAQPSPLPQSDAAPKAAPKPALKPKSEASPVSVPESSPSPTDTPTPTPTPTPAPAPTPIVLAKGTALSIRTTSAISTNDSKSNQEFEASLAKPVLSGNEVVIPNQH
jgi:outer membrane biosynthesis protein TonB